MHRPIRVLFYHASMAEEFDLDRILPADAADRYDVERAIVRI
jgi:hypothetical protein